MKVQTAKQGGPGVTPRVTAAGSARWGLAAILVLVFIVTLTPADRGGYVPFFCLVCGERGVADALRNIILFVPLGAALALQVRSRWWAWSAVVFLSGAIEFAQFFIPGRHAGFGDIVYNALGAGVGVLASGSYRRWLCPSDAVGNGLSLAATGVAAGLFILTGYLLAPSLPDAVYYGLWTPRLGYLEQYDGRVLDTAIGPLRLPPNRLDASDSARVLLRAGAPLRVRAVAGPAVGGLAPLFGIYDEEQREILLLGLDRTDLVFRYRTRATSWRLDQSDLRASGAMRLVSAGGPLDVTVQRDGSSYCMTLNRSVDCGLGFSVGSGWALLLYVEAWPGWLKLFLGLGWIAVLAFPISFWPRAAWPAILGTIAVYGGLVLFPPFLHLKATAPIEFLAAGGGLLAGWRAGPLVRRLVRGSSGP